jgi:traG family protein
LISALYECLFEKFILHSWFITIKLNDKSTSISTLLDSLIPASMISKLTKGTFVGAASDNSDERIEQKIFHAEIVVDSAKVSAENEGLPAHSYHRGVHKQRWLR